LCEDHFPAEGQNPNDIVLCERPRRDGIVNTNRAAIVDRQFRAICLLHHPVCDQFCQGCLFSTDALFGSIQRYRRENQTLFRLEPVFPKPIISKVYPLLDFGLYNGIFGSVRAKRTQNRSPF
jgi:hypothetical protein